MASPNDEEEAVAIAFCWWIINTEKEKVAGKQGDAISQLYMACHISILLHHHVDLDLAETTRISLEMCLYALQTH